MKALPSLSLYLLASIVFTWLFFETEPGANYLAFFLLSLIPIHTILRKPGTVLPWPAIIAAGLQALAVFLYGEERPAVQFWICWIMVPVSVAAGLYAFPVAFFQGMGTGVLAPFGIALNVFREVLEQRLGGNVRKRILQLGVIGVMLVFGLIYLNVSEVLVGSLDYLYDWLSNLSLSFIPFLFLGLVVTAGLFFRPSFLPLFKFEQLAASFPAIALPADWSSESLLRKMLIGLSILALLPAVVDGASLLGLIPMYKEIVISAELHRSVILLVFSCLLIAALTGLLFSNRKGQANGLEKYLYIFLAANLALIVITALKNTLYIDFMGLSFKRIGVFFWLGLVVSGLGLTYQMVARGQSMYILIRNGSWAALLTMCSYVAMPVDYWVRVSQMNRLKPDFAYLESNLSANELVQVPGKAHKVKLAQRDKWQSFCIAAFNANRAKASLGVAAPNQ